MNERIKELAVEAGFYANPDIEKFEKFAELIVRECMAICDDVSKKNNTAVDCWIEIKRTFRS